MELVNLKNYFTKYFKNFDEYEKKFEIYKKVKKSLNNAQLKIVEFSQIVKNLKECKEELEILDNYEKSSEFIKLELYEKAINLWGEDAQKKMILEEVNEFMMELLLKLCQLNQIVCKEFRKRFNKKTFIDELADVSIMMDQAPILFKCRKEFEQRKRFKILRLAKKMEKNEVVDIQLNDEK